MSGWFMWIIKLSQMYSFLLKLHASPCPLLLCPRPAHAVIVLAESSQGQLLSAPVAYKDDASVQ